MQNEHSKRVKLLFFIFSSPYPSTLNDSDRDAMDAQAEEMVHSCNQLLQLLELNISSRDLVDGDDKQSLPSIPSGSQYFEHRNAVCKLLRSYLKLVCDELSAQRAIRLQYQVEKKKSSRIVQNAGKITQIENYQEDVYQTEYPEKAAFTAQEEQLVSKLDFFRRILLSRFSIILVCLGK